MRRLLLLVVLAAIATPAEAKRVPRKEFVPEAERWVIRPGREAQIQGLLGDLGFNHELPGGYRFGSISIERSRIVYTLHSGGANSASDAGRLELAPKVLAAPGEPTTRSFVLRPRALGDDPRVPALLSAASASVAAHDDGTIYDYLGKPIAHPLPEVLGLRPLYPHALLLAGALLTLIIVVFRHRPVTVSNGLRLPHLLQLVVQTSLYAYWAVYWSGMREYLPLLLLQLGFAFVVDACLSFSVRGHWPIGLAPVPIVLSLNLFLQFPVEHQYLSFCAILVGLLSKVLIHRGGRHVFNPSAIGVAVIGAFNLVFPRIGDGDVSDELNLPPNMGEVMLLLALLIQFRLPVVLITLSGAAALMSWIHLTGYHYFYPFWPPIMAAFLLLVTDPATSPRTGIGQVLYGACFGLLLGITATLLEENGISDFYGKVLPIPIVNLMLPLFDRAGAWLEARARWLAAILQPRFNFAHVFLWVVFAVFGLTAGNPKAGSFVPELHAHYATPLIQLDTTGQVSCARNPIFCRPFSFGAEIGGWRQHPHPPSGSRAAGTD